jgi:hypothetical protein
MNEKRKVARTRLILERKAAYFTGARLSQPQHVQKQDAARFFGVRTGSGALRLGQPRSGDLFV